MGILFVLLCATGLGTAICYVLGLGGLGRQWHVGVGVAGVISGQLLVTYFPIPYVIRIAVNGWPVYPVWAAIGTLLAAMAVGALEPRQEF